MTFGLTPQGFVAMKLADVKADLDAAWRAAFGQNVKLDTRSVNGTIIGIVSERLAVVWAQLEEAYFAAYRDSATGVHLDRVAALAGLTRKPATKSVVTQSILGTPTTAIPVDSAVSDGSENATPWKLLALATIGGGGSVTASFSPDAYGPVQALAGTLTTIVDPVAGWASTINTADATLGTEAESDASLRQRILLARAAAGSSKLAGIIAAVSRVAGVTEVQGFENTSIDVDDDGRPGKSFEILAVAPEDDDIDDLIAQAIWDAKPAGIEAYGVDSSGDAVDSEGETREIPFTRPADVDIYVTAEVETNGFYPEDGDALVAAEILAFEELVYTGRDVAPFAIAQLVETPGVDKLTIKLGLSASPTSTDVLVIGKRQRAALDSSRIVVVHV